MVIGLALKGDPYDGASGSNSVHAEMTVAVIGCGYVGSVVAAGLAYAGQRVTGIEIDPDRLVHLREGRISFYEPDLEKLIRRGIAEGQLSFTGTPDGVAGADVVFVCVDAPAGDDGAADLSHVAAAVASVAEHLRPGQVLVSKSTLPAGGSAWMEKRLADLGVVGCPVVVNPEFLREGAAVGDFLHPDRIVLGGEPGAVAQVRRVLEPILTQAFETGRRERRPELVLTDRASAEVLKHAANAFLASRVSLINEIAEVCVAVGADVRVVAEAVGLDARIGPSFLEAGLGWGGSCFGKDLEVFGALARSHGVEPTLTDAIRASNYAHRDWVVRMIQQELGGLEGRRIGLLGLAFKPGTSDLRDSPAVDLAERLIAAGASVCAHDPAVATAPGVEGLAQCADVGAVAWRADAVVLATEWPEFVNADLEHVATLMEGDLLVDLRNAWDARRVAAAGLRHVGVGILPPPDDDTGFEREAVGHG